MNVLVYSSIGNVSLRHIRYCIQFCLNKVSEFQEIQIPPFSWKHHAYISTCAIVSCIVFIYLYLAAQSQFEQEWPNIGLLYFFPGLYAAYVTFRCFFLPYRMNHNSIKLVQFCSKVSALKIRKLSEVTYIYSKYFRYRGKYDSLFNDKTNAAEYFWRIFVGILWKGFKISFNMKRLTDSAFLEILRN